MPAGRRLSAVEVARAAGLRHDPTPEQAAIIEAPLAPLLVVAGAGSGKTETMAARVVWLVANGLVQPDQVLGLTFTRKAAGELAERITHRLRRLEATGLWRPPAEADGTEGLGGLPTVSTYHSYAGRLVREHGMRLGHEPDARLLSEAAAWQHAAEAVLRHDADLTAMTKAESTVIAGVLDLAGEMAEHLLDPDDVRRELDRLITAIEATPARVADGSSRSGRGSGGGSRGGGGRSGAGMPSPLRALLATLRERLLVVDLVQGYQALKRSRDALDFADQVALAARLSRRFPEIGRAERRAFRAVLLDEFQDTSEAQLVLLRELFVAEGEPVPVTAVGDPHQSIYGWRGASSTTLARFPDVFAERPPVVADQAGRPGPAGESAARRPAQVRQLSTTWRNDAAVLAVANLVATPLREASRVPVDPLVARPDARAGEVVLARLGTQAEEADVVARWIVEARSRGVTTAAVLCRKRSQFEPVIQALKSLDVPVEVVGLGGLLLTPEVVDLVALLRVVSDPTRGDALIRLLTGALCRLGAADLDTLHEWARYRQRVNRPREQPDSELDPALRDEDDGTGRHAGRDRLGAPGPESIDARSSGHPADPPATGPGRSGPDLGRPGPDRLVELAPDAVDEPSLVEAVEELPPDGWRSPGGGVLAPAARTRLEGLAAAIRRVRRLTGLPLAELVGEAERALGLDIEVLARPEYPPAAARAHLDAFTDVAAAFSASADRPTLAGFLAWLDAALAEERGLDVGHLEPSPGAVQVLTVHAAKGLEWDVVAVPGLVEGVFPARDVRPKHGPAGWTCSPPTASGWLTGLGAVPYRLRGDRVGLPVFDPVGAADLAEVDSRRVEFRTAEGQRQLTEERRLAYVALTRARHRLLLTASIWGTPRSVRVTSPFLLQVHEQAAALGVRVQRWDEMPGPDAVKPDTGDSTPVLWPVDPLALRRTALDRAAEAVRTARADRVYAQSPMRVAGPLLVPHAADVELLLADRRAALARQQPTVLVPRHLTASDLVALAADPVGFALGVRRPMPTPPAIAARRGTAFHAWVEQHFARAALVDLGELPGAADDDAGPDDALPVLQANFLASEWAGRVPVDVEIAVETVLDGIAVRGRIDAVFPRDDGGLTVVDWKTGPPPTGEAARVRTIQLGAYALAYARLRGLPADRVDAAFFYAATGRTVRPALPGEADLVELLRTLTLPDLP